MSMRPTRNMWRRASGCLLLSAAILGVYSVSPAQGSDDLSVGAALVLREKLGFSTSEDLARSLAADPTADRTYGLPLSDEEVADMRLRDRISTDLEPLRAHMDAHPNRYGQLYLGRAPGGIVVVELTAAADASDRAAAIDAAPREAVVRFVEVTNSRGDLAHAQRAVEEAIRNDPSGVRGIVGFGQVAEQNRLEINVLPDRLDEVRTRLASMLDLDLLVFRAGDYDRNTTCSSRTNCWEDPLRGGIRVNPDDCTTGAVVYRRTDDMKRMLTAGHCIHSDPGVMRYHLNDPGSHHLGTRSNDSYVDYSFGDFGLLSMSEHQGMAGNLIYTDDDHSFAITSIDDVDNNQWVCQEGSHGGHRCGHVNRIDYYSVGDDGIELMHQATATYTPVPGDSGAPVHTGHELVGTQSRVRGDGDAVFSRVVYLEVALDSPISVCLTSGC